MDAHQICIPFLINLFELAEKDIAEKAEIMSETSGSYIYQPIPLGLEFVC
jgi:hypothetical protein